MSISINKAKVGTEFLTGSEVVRIVSMDETVRMVSFMGIEPKPVPHWYVKTEHVSGTPCPSGMYWHYFPRDVKLRQPGVSGDEL